MKYGKRLTKYSAFLLILLPLTILFCQNAWANPLPDTGQTKCYNNTEEIACPLPGEDFYGQDGNYLINPPSYTKLDAAGNDLADSATSWVMVRDNVTGLIWEVKTDDGSVHDKDNKYTWQNAQDVFIAQVNASNFGAHSDWRLPTIKEFPSIGNLGTYEPAIDTEFFPNTISYNYWSTNTISSLAWCVSFAICRADYHDMTNHHYVRCVRGGQANNSFVNNGDNTVTDSSTGLMWQQDTSPEDYLWEGALSYSESLTLAGYDDWRLPNRKELLSIVNYEKKNPAINTEFFPNTTYLSFYWTGSSYVETPLNASIVSFKRGTTGGHNKTHPSTYCYVRCVRGGQGGSSHPIVITTPISLVTLNSASSGGNVTSDGGASVTSRGVCWDTSANPTKSDNTTSDGTGTGSFTSNITGLSPNTTYHVRAYATNTTGTAYGSDVTFTTYAVPTATTNSATSVTANSATLNGTVNPNGASTTTIFEYGTTTGYGSTVTATQSPLTGTNSQSVSANLTSLTQGVAYHFRVKATNSAGTVYGDDQTFSTTTTPSITTTAISSITSNSASSGGNVTSEGGATVTAKGVCWSTSVNPTTSDSKATNATGTGSFTSSITGLRSNTIYHVRAYAINSNGTAYGNDLGFTTSGESTWTVMDSGTQENILDIWGISNDNIFAACTGDLILHYNGSTWVKIREGNSSIYYTDVWGTSGEDVFVVGSLGTILHYDGSMWESMTSGTSEDLQGVWGNSKSNVFAVSSGGTILHYDGNVDGTWNVMNSGTIMPFWGVWGSSDTDVFAAGNNGTVFHYDGNDGLNWSVSCSGIGHNLEDVWGSSNSDVFAVGMGGTILHFDGSSWVSITGVTTKQLWGVWCNSSVNVFTVGVDGVIFHYDGSTWSEIESGTSVILHNVWGISDTDVFAVGRNGTILHYSPPNTIPTITTTAPSLITSDGVSSGGNVTSDGGATVTARGVCWNTSANPTTSDNKTTDGTGTSSFTSVITALSPSTTYHVRAYASNTLGTAYGSDVTFTTSAPPTTTTTSTSTTTTSTTSTSTTTTSTTTTSTTTTSTTTTTTTSTTSTSTTSTSTTSTSTTSTSTTTTTSTTSTSTTSTSTTTTTSTTSTSTTSTSTTSTSTTTTTSTTSTSTTTTTTTLPTTPTVTTELVTSVTSRSATLNGTVNPNGAETSYYFEYGTTSRYGLTTTITSGGSGTSNVSANAHLTGLSPNSTYHYRLAAYNSSGTAYGADQTLTTSTPKSSIVLSSVSGARGKKVVIPIILSNIEGSQIASLSVDVGYDTTYFEKPRGAIGPAGSASEKTIGTSELSSGIFRMTILSVSNNNVIGDGIIAYLTLTILSNAPGSASILTSTPSASDPSGSDVAVEGASGTITILGNMAGDCNGDGIVTISEVQSAINMYLGINAVEECVDVNDNGKVSIGELQKVINNHLNINAATALAYLEGSGNISVRATALDGSPSLDIGNVTGSPGETVTVAVTLTNASGYLVSGVSTDITYDTSYLESPSVSIGAAGTSAGKDVSFNEISSGTIRVGVFSASNNNAIGDGIVAYVSFKIKSSASSGQTTLGNAPSGSDPSGNDITMDGADGVVTVSYSSTRYVNKDGVCGGEPLCHTTIQDAINTASTGEAIMISADTYDESITLDADKSLTLIGSSTGSTILRKAPKAPKGSLTLQRVTILP